MARTSLAGETPRCFLATSHQPGTHAFFRGPVGPSALVVVGSLEEELFLDQDSRYCLRWPYKVGAGKQLCLCYPPVAASSMMAMMAGRLRSSQVHEAVYDRCHREVRTQVVDLVESGNYRLLSHKRKCQARRIRLTAILQSVTFLERPWQEKLRVSRSACSGATADKGLRRYGLPSSPGTGWLPACGEKSLPVPLEEQGVPPTLSCVAGVFRERADSTSKPRHWRLHRQDSLLRWSSQNIKREDDVGTIGSSSPPMSGVAVCSHEAEIPFQDSRITFVAPLGQAPTIRSNRPRREG